MKIEFIAYNEDTYEYIDRPVSASKIMPEWYRKSKRFKNSNELSFNEQGFPSSTIKSCMPVFDAISFGYIQKTWTDIFIEKSGDELKYFWSNGPEIITVKPQYTKQMLPTPHGYLPTMFSWKRYWIPKTPKGYSTMLMHPMYHTDLPFVCLPGIMDSDKHYQDGSSPPFFIRDDFEGLIPKGTPMYQIFPFKRDNWFSTFEYKKYEKNIKKNRWNMNTKFLDRYKKISWVKKDFK